MHKKQLTLALLCVGALTSSASHAGRTLWIRIDCPEMGKGIDLTMVGEGKSKSLRARTIVNQAEDPNFRDDVTTLNFSNLNPWLKPEVKAPQISIAGNDDQQTVTCTYNDQDDKPLFYLEDKGPFHSCEKKSETEVQCQSAETTSGAKK